jgi:methionyl-tRNA formyltransferase
MPRFALLTTECAQLGDAVTELVERHHGSLALVVTSDFGRGGLVRQAMRNIRRSGLVFTSYLVVSFLAYPLALAVDRLLAPLRSGRRVRLSIAELCAWYRIPHVRTADVNGADVVARLREADVDFVVVYWFDQILHEQVIKVPRRAVVNVHAAHLPGCRGLFPSLYTILEENRPFGITAHLVESREIDSGPVLSQRIATPPQGRSVLFYDSWVNRTGVDVVGAVLNDFTAHAENARPQPPGGSYYSYPSRAQVKALRRKGVRMWSPQDFFAVLRGTGAGAQDDIPWLP